MAVDLKNTSSMTVQFSYPQQLAAYVNAEYVGIKGTRQLVPLTEALDGKKIKHVANLFITPDKRVKAVPGSCRAVIKQHFNTAADFQAFVHLRNYWQYKFNRSAEDKQMPVIIKEPSPMAVRPDLLPKHRVAATINEAAAPKERAFTPSAAAPMRTETSKVRG